MRDLSLLKKIFHSAGAKALPSHDKLLEMFAGLVKIRNTELRIEEHYHEDEMKTPVHLALGQEAVSVGVCAHLNKEDFVFSNHRSHAHYLAKGGDLKAMMAELYCKETGCSRGRGGSMHLIDTKVGHRGSSSIVGGSIPHAVGAAFASVMLKQGRVAVSFFGDAASEQGVFFESMNWAAFKNLPVIFVCENNYYSVYSHLSARQVNMDISTRPRAFGIPSLKVNGMDLLDVYGKAQGAVEHARAGKGPFFLECCVQRWRGHAGAGDPKREKYRKPEELKDGYQKDPLKDFREFLLQKAAVDGKTLREIEERVDAQIDEAFRYAQSGPLPRREDLEKYLFS